MMIRKSVSMLFSFFLVLTVLFMGCGGPNSQLTNANSKIVSSAQKSTANSPAAGVDKNPQSSQPSPSQIKDTRPLIVAFGDSLTAGYGTKAGESYPDYLERELNARGYHYRVLNEGVSGNTSKDGVLRALKVASLHPAIVIVAFGGNDGLRGIPIADTEMNLASIITTFHDVHAQVVLGGITLPPNYGSDYTRRFGAIFADVAAATKAALVPFLLAGVADAPDAATLFQADRIHPIAAAQPRLLDNVWPALRKLLPR